MNFIIELFKLIFSLFCLLIENIHNQNTSIIQFKLKNSIYFAMPGVLYFINNNLAVSIQLYMDSTSYQMLSNFKILSTAILYYFIMGKKLTRLKWFSLVLLFCAGLFYVYGNLKSLITDDDNNNLPDHTVNQLRVSDQIYITKIGVLLIVIYCFISGLSGVYSEYILKLNYSDSIYVQNIYLYIYGSILNLIACLIEFKFNLYNDDNKSMKFFNGFNYLTWIIIGTQCFNGFLMSIVMKHSNNITRLFVISCSLIVTAVLSVLIFSLKLNFYFYFSFFIIMIALYLNLNY
jgi:solute carrier family 35 (probable UDP-sugar transporter), member A4